MAMMLGLIRSLCKKNNVTLKQLESDLGFGNKTIFSWEKSSPSIDKVRMVADYFGVSIDYLIGRTTPDALSPDETELILLYRLLNDDGKAMVREYIEYISSKDKYKKCNFASELEA